jgi:hypothetical protein
MLRSSSLYSLLEPLATSSLGPSILLSTLFSNNFSTSFFLSVRENVSHPYSKKGYKKIKETGNVEQSTVY